MESRMKNPAVTLPEALPHLLALGGIVRKAGVAQNLLELVNLRASQINGCGFCVDMHSRDLKKNGETDQRLFSVAAWREAPFFTDAERAALALTESATRISDQSDPVPDAIWDEVCRFFDETQRSALVFNIAFINFWNRTNVATRQIAGTGW